MAKPDNYEAFAKMHEVFRLGIFFESFGERIVICTLFSDSLDLIVP